MPDILDLLHTAPEPPMSVPIDTLLARARGRARAQRIRRYAVGGGLLAAAVAAILFIASGGLPKSAPVVPATPDPGRSSGPAPSPSEPTPTPEVIRGSTTIVLPLSTLDNENYRYEVAPTGAGYQVVRVDGKDSEALGSLPLPSLNSPISWLSDPRHPTNQLILTLPDADVAVVAHGGYRWQIPLNLAVDVELRPTADGRAKITLIESPPSGQTPITAGVVVRESGEILSTEKEAPRTGETIVGGLNVRMAYLESSDVWLCWIGNAPCRSFNLSDRQDDVRTMLARPDTGANLEAYLPPADVTDVAVRTSTRDSAPMTTIRLGERVAYVVALNPGELFRDMSWTTSEGNRQTIAPPRG